MKALIIGDCHGEMPEIQKEDFDNVHDLNFNSRKFGYWNFIG
jgi:hypothetical protein